jgi:hypothetical protein
MKEVKRELADPTPQLHRLQWLALRTGQTLGERLMQVLGKFQIRQFLPNQANTDLKNCDVHNSKKA